MNRPRGRPRTRCAWTSRRWTRSTLWRMDFARVSTQDRGEHCTRKRSSPPLSCPCGCMIPQHPALCQPACIRQCGLYGAIAMIFVQIIGKIFLELYYLSSFNFIVKLIDISRGTISASTTNHELCGHGWLIFQGNSAVERALLGHVEREWVSRLGELADIPPQHLTVRTARKGLGACVERGQ